MLSFSNTYFIFLSWFIYLFNIQNCFVIPNTNKLPGNSTLVFTLLIYHGNEKLADRGSFKASNSAAEFSQCNLIQF